MSPKSWPSSVAPAPGAITDVNLIQYLGVACGPLNPVDTLEISPTAVIEGQVTLTGAAQQLPNEPCRSVTLENVSTNAVVCIGHDNAVTLLNGYRLQPGATWSLAIDNVNRVWVIGTALQIISYGGVN